MDRDMYRHISEAGAFEEVKKVIRLEKEIESICNEIENKLKAPDLLGKTIRVTNKQFTNLYKMLIKQSEYMGIPVPNLFVYEDFYYGIQSKGTNEPWIEISAKTVQDLSNDEIEFLLAREMYNIKYMVTYYNSIFEELLKIVDNANFIIGVDALIDTIKIKIYQWDRLCNYSADCYGYLKSKNIKVCINAIIKLILNNTYLAEQVNIKSYIDEARAINNLDDLVYDYSKLDEMVPYGPHRIKNIIAYASSTRGIEAIKNSLI